jgi:hypothetical protein
MNTDDLLENRHTIYLEWVEPWTSCGPEGNDLPAHVIHRATVHDCVNMARLAAKKRGASTMGQDADFLLDFVAVHWATIY